MTQIRVVAQGSSKWDRLIRRWGVAFLIGEDVIFDTFGDPQVLLRNMSRWGIDAAKIKHIVLSHDDWDHIAGLWPLISGRPDITVYICPGFKQELKDGIGLLGVKVIESAGEVWIKDNIYSAGELSGMSGDRMVFEQSLVIKTEQALAVVCGCAHPGVVEIVRHVQKVFSLKVDLVMGGFHLKDHAKEDIQRVADALLDLGVSRIAPMHCTGSAALKCLCRKFGAGFIAVKEGDVIRV